LDLSATYGQVHWDVTAYVQGMLDGSWVNNGFYFMRENDETDPQEHTRKFGLLQLVVTYDTVTPTPAPTPQPMVAITNADRADPVYAGDEVVYTILVRNVSDEPLENVWLEDTIPEGTTFVEASGGGAFSEDGTVSWGIPTLAPGSSYSAELTLRTLSSSPDGTVLTNWVEVGYTYRQHMEEAVRIYTQEAAETTTVNRRPEPVRPPPETCLLDEAADDFDTATQIAVGQPGLWASICPADRPSGSSAELAWRMSSSPGGWGPAPPANGE
jgi:uncharacterized repeat protein (TIGR01451 family)